MTPPFAKGGEGGFLGYAPRLFENPSYPPFTKGGNQNKADDSQNKDVISCIFLKCSKTLAPHKVIIDRVWCTNYNLIILVIRMR
jgi:hypothetical protein